MLEIGLCVEMLFDGKPLDVRFEKAAELGFRNVEIWMVDGTFKGKPRELSQMASDAGVRITNTVIGSPDGSVGGGLTNPQNRDSWLERARTTMEFTREAGIHGTIVCTGNVVPGMTDEEMMASVLEGLRPTVEMAEKAGITLLLEPLNTAYDHRGYWLTSSDLGAEICRRIESKRMRLLFDCYHLQIMEGDLANHIQRNIDVIGHFHCAGVPGRHEPHLGEVNYPFLLKHIDALGYSGVFGLEYRPSMEHELSLQETLRHLKVRA
jgi:hydroxypyruvate isomerase